MPNKKEAAAAVAQIVERNKRDLVKKAVTAMSQRGGQNTTPSPDEFPSRIGSKSVFNRFVEKTVRENPNFKIGEDAPFDAESIDESGLYELSATGARKSVSQQKYFIYVFSLVYFYLESKSEGNDGRLRKSHFDTPEGLVNHNMSLALQYLRKDYGTFENIDFSDSPGSVDPTTEIIYISSFPQDRLERMEEEIKDKLHSMGILGSAASAIAAFPYKMSDTSNNGGKTFYEKLCHEFTHRYIREAYESQNMKSQTIEEAFAWFSGIYLEKGLDFDHGPENYEHYNEPETITWMIDFLRETVKMENPENVIDWTREKGRELLKNNYTLSGSDKVEFAQFLLPNYNQRASKLDRICQGELQSVVNDFKKELQKLETKEGPKHQDIRDKIEDMNHHLDEFDLPDDFEKHILEDLIHEMIQHKWGIPTFMEKFDDAVEKERKELEAMINDLTNLAKLLSRHDQLSDYPEIKNVAIRANYVGKDLEELEY